MASLPVLAVTVAVDVVRPGLPSPLRTAWRPRPTPSGAAKVKGPKTPKTTCYPALMEVEAANAADILRSALLTEPSAQTRTRQRQTAAVLMVAMGFAVRCTSVASAV